MELTPMMISRIFEITAKSILKEEEKFLGLKGFKRFTMNKWWRVNIYTKKTL
jgi:hypothetical protein